MFKNRKKQGHKMQNGRINSSSVGVCSCPKCDYSVTHKRGIPCTTLTCPVCHTSLIRQVSPVKSDKQQVTNKTTQIINKTTPITKFPKVDIDICIGCGTCVNICPSKAINMKDGKAEIDITNCKNCRACVITCPVEAIV